ncbi:MAG TPA: glycosyltransferase family 9 protein [Flavobacterium sp.]
MSNLNKINVFRQALMRGLTRNVGKLNSQQDVLVNKDEIKRILICRPNARLGNLLLITPLVNEVAEGFPNCKVDLFVKGSLASIIFENYDCVSKIIELPKKPFKNLLDYMKVWISIKKQKYDIVINVEKESSSGRLVTQFSNSKYKFFGDLPVQSILDYEDCDHIAKYPIYHFRDYLAKLGLEKRNNKIKSLDIKLSSFEIEEGKKTLDSLADYSKKTICLFTYATGVKCLSKEWWEDFYASLKVKYEDYNIIEILPIENVSQIDFQAPAFYSKDIREIGALITNSSLFIGADSGMMHLGSSVKTPTLGLFSVSNKKKYEPYNEGSLGVDIYSCSKDEYFKIIDGILTTTN